MNLIRANTEGKDCRMRIKSIAAVLGGLTLPLFLAACTDILDDRGEMPTVSVSFLDTAPATTVSSLDGELGDVENCAYVPANKQQQRIIVSFGDAGGLSRVRISSLGGRITLDSFEPALADVVVERGPFRSSLDATFPPVSDGVGYVSALARITLDLGARDGTGTGFVAEATDFRGNVGSVRFVLEETDSGIVCRGREIDGP